MREVGDGLRFPVQEDFEIGLRQVANGLSMRVGNRSVDLNQVDGNAEARFLGADYEQSERSR
jgi:hypothetical protein